MGLLRRLFPSPQPRAVNTRTAHVYGGYETLEVVGESHYQETLWRLVGGRCADLVRCETIVVLVPDPHNEYDPNAIEVRIDGELVGYLSREDAAAYRPGIPRLMQQSGGQLVALHAHIVGGGPRPDGIGFLGVFIDHDPVDFGLASHHVSHGQIRTGLSEALATDLEDDSYDLSWLRTLAADEQRACEQLRKLLKDEKEPIDRHFMFCELTQRLYRARGASAAALQAFDDACEDYHREMSTIRQALLDKFGCIPLIDMYRQAAIRYQRTKDWDRVREWAERGLAVYGNDVVRPEFVEDLHKRVAYAEAKIQAAANPRPRKPHGSTVTVARAPIVEELVCSSCGTTFSRERTRGRKPKLCPACRGATAPVPTS